MQKCERCKTENPESSKFCGACATPLPNHSPNSPASMLATEAVPTAAAYVRSRPVSRHNSSTTDSSEDGRFVPGTLLGDRFRIINLLGAGGMGEVYRATDLRLGQAVALKFLPEEAALDPKALARFNNEVRIARQVAHPNVCRVYDIGEVEGLVYLSMEYVDGEDLHSLLRRIGRLPADKALEIARKLCAGLAAAHDRGVLHRDLKPANIMIDGRGHVLITDFGLAGIMGQIEGAEARNGTPGYMAPEQLSGKEVSAQSDIYALGVVLYEMFTGKRPFIAATRAEMARLAEEGMPPAPRSIVKDIDPAVESVILRCLAPDPRQRPPSAISVLAGLPGGDPLAAALAAGETPSPEMVAASGQKAGMKPAQAMLWLGGTIALLAINVVLNQRVSTFGKIPMDKPPDVLMEKAREIAQNLGYADAPKSTARGFDYRWAILNSGTKGANFEFLRRGRPPAMVLWYRSSPASLVPAGIAETPRVTPTDPPENVPGMLHVVVDMQGRLINFFAVPPEYDTASGPFPAPDWAPVFAAAGLDISRFKLSEPHWAPHAMADSRLAWTGSYAEAPEIPLRVEAAAYHGKPISFAEVLERGGTPETGRSTGALVYLTLQLIVLIGSFPIARYNLRLGRGDTKGAIRLALFFSACCLSTWIIGGTHAAGEGEADLFMKAAMRAVFGGVTIALTYLSFEPFVRRKWPQTIISWSRLLAGGFSDPLVGRDLLVGTCSAIALSLVLVAGLMITQASGIPALHAPSELTPLLGGRFIAGAFFSEVTDTLNKSLGILFLLFVARALLHKEWLAAALVTIALAAMEATNSSTPLIAWPVNLLFFGLMVMTVMRCGLLTLAVTIFFAILIGQFPLSSDFSVWYSGEVIFLLAVTLGTALYGFRTALAGQSVIKSQ